MSCWRNGLSATKPASVVNVNVPAVGGPIDSPLVTRRTSPPTRIACWPRSSVSTSRSSNVRSRVPLSNTSPNGAVIPVTLMVGTIAAGSPRVVSMIWTDPRASFTARPAICCAPTFRLPKKPWNGPRLPRSARPSVADDEFGAALVALVLADPARRQPVRRAEHVIDAAEVLIEADVVGEEHVGAADRRDGAARRRQIALIEIAAVAALVGRRRREVAQEARGHAVRRRAQDVVAQLRRLHLERVRALDLVAGALVGAEEERPVAEDRSAQRGAELVERLRRRDRREVVAGVQRIAAEVLPGAAAQHVGARARLHVDHRPVAAAELGGEVQGLDLHLLDRFQRRHDRRLAGVVRVGVHRPVEDVVVAAIAVAVDRDHRRAGQLGRIRGARNEGGAGAQTRQQEHVALRQRQVLDLGAAEGVRQPALARHRHGDGAGGDVDRFPHVGDAERDRDVGGFADREPQAILREGPEAGHVRAERVDARGQPGEQERARGITGGLAADAGFGVAGSDDGAGEDVSRGVDDAALDGGVGDLRAGGRRAEEEQDHGQPAVEGLSTTHVHGCGDSGPAAPRGSIARTR